MQRWRLSRLLRAWQHQAAGCAAGRALLLRMAAQADGRARGAAFAAWRAHASGQRARLAAFEATAAVRHAQHAQRDALLCWRGHADDRHGSRLQLAHARQVLARRRVHAALRTWLHWQQHRAERRLRWQEAAALLRQRCAAMALGAAFAGWRDQAAAHREQRLVFMR
jgi:hypothetical protein